MSTGEGGGQEKGLKQEKGKKTDRKGGERVEMWTPLGRKKRRCRERGGTLEKNRLRSEG